MAEGGGRGIVSSALLLHKDKVLHVINIYIIIIYIIIIYNNIIKKEKRKRAAMWMDSVCVL